ncbi:ABC transporter permease [Pseudoclavibacter caeni]|uniref:ABC transporter permease subunit n=1 Tax=Pseudoclavibacter caeni TaxID=908846 RepID=A0A7C8FY70_9MICO|nr:ABC transporter permease subunit [Pseudoclavibacter caeni]KAB1633760.1 ABC transporter permease subunit [Pseudoclavibacter caeni]NYJ96205.1 ABC-type nitrate/sulfonate/bicarbonate transport system permease component [Pseudoclavibacter caeni]
MNAMITDTRANAVIEVRGDLRREMVRATLRALGRSLVTALGTLLIVLVLWQAVISFTKVSPYVAKGPADVWAWLVSGKDATTHLSDILGLVGVTLVDTVAGFVAGMVAALVLAVVFRLSRGVQTAVMPIALLLRSVPLVAIAPVIILITGIGSPASVAVIGGIVVLFPALANIMFGLASASPQALDVVRVYGGGTWTAIRKVALPSALPSIFAATRISVPGAITGALLAEWLSTGTGVGGMINKYITQAQFSALWSAVVIVTLIALVLYNLVQLAENVVLTRMGLRR